MQREFIFNSTSNNSPEHQAILTLLVWELQAAYDINDDIKNILIKMLNSVGWENSYLVRNILLLPKALGLPQINYLVTNRMDGFDYSNPTSLLTLGIYFIKCVNNLNQIKQSLINILDFIDAPGNANIDSLIPLLKNYDIDTNLFLITRTQVLINEDTEEDTAEILKKTLLFSCGIYFPLSNQIDFKGIVMNLKARIDSGKVSPLYNSDKPYVDYNPQSMDALQDEILSSNALSHQDFTFIRDKYNLGLQTTYNSLKNLSETKTLNLLTIFASMDLSINIQNLKSEI